MSEQLIFSHILYRGGNHTGKEIESFKNSKE